MAASVVRARARRHIVGAHRRLIQGVARGPSAARLGDRWRGRIRRDGRSTDAQRSVALVGTDGRAARAAFHLDKRRDAGRGRHIFSVLTGRRGSVGAAARERRTNNRPWRNCASVRAREGERKRGTRVRRRAGLRVRRGSEGDDRQVRRGREKSPGRLRVQQFSRKKRPTESD